MGVLILNPSVLNKSLFTILFHQLILLLSCAFICVFARAPVLNGILFFLYQLFGIFIPGLACSVLLRKKTDLFEDDILYGYAFGVMIVLIEYIVYMCLLHFLPAIVLTALVAVLSLVFLYFRRDAIRAASLMDQIVCRIMMIMMFVICFFAITYHYVPVERYGSSIFNKDFLFWVGNSISFVKGFPAQSFRLAGQTFYYYYFSNILMASASMNTGISVLDLSYDLSYLIPCILMVYACRDFLGSLLKNRILIYAGMIFIFFVHGTTVYLPDHIYYCPFGFDYGYAFAMIAAACLVRMYRKDGFNVLNVVISCLFIIADTGFKGPVALIALMAFGIVAFSSLIQKKWVRGLVCGFLWLISFISIYLLVVSGISFAVERTNGIEFLGPLGAFDRNRWAIGILSELIGKGMADNGITRIIALFLYVFRSNKAAMALLIAAGIGLIVLWIMKKKDQTVLLSLICTALWGILLTVITHQDGNSQMYFIMAAFPFAVLSGLYAVEESGFGKVFEIVMIVLIFVISVGDIRHFVCDSVNGQIKDALLLQKGEETDGDDRYRFTTSEVKLAEWLKENTGEHDLIVMDRFEYDEMRKEEMLGVFSERYIWNDGLYCDEKEMLRRRQITDRAFRDDKAAFDELRSEGVNYMIQTLSQDQTVLHLEIIYEADGFRVYAL